MTTTEPFAVMLLLASGSGSGAAGAERVLEPLPCLRPPIRMATRRLRRLRLDPADPLRAGVVEAVDAADAGEDDVARPKRRRLAVELGLDLAGQEEVRLLERVVVRLRRAADLVVDREDREQVGTEDAIDEHLDGDPAVGEEGRVHACRTAPARRIADGEGFRLGRRPGVAADPADGRVTEARRTGRGRESVEVERSRLEEGVFPPAAGRKALRRVDGQPANLPLAAVRQRV